MQRLSGLLLVLSGVALAAYAYVPSPSDGAAELAEVTRISAAPDRQARRDEPNVRTFSPASPAFRELIDLREAASTELASASTSDASTPAVLRPAASKSLTSTSGTSTSGGLTPGTWTTVVSTEESGSALLRSPQTNDAETRAELARDLQVELKRVGCYGGEITGSWNAATRRAMAAFIDRANATLPIGEPDYILLALVQNHRDIACSAVCPSGQVSAEGGRCMPRAVMAQASKKQKRLDEQRLAAARLGAGDDPAPVAATEPERLPWQRSGYQPRTETVAQVVVEPTPEARAEPLPGRMSIGGPDAAALPPSTSVAAPSSDWKPTFRDALGRTVTIDAANSGKVPSQVAAVAPGDDASAAADGAPVASAEGDGVPVSDETSAKPRKSGKSHASRNARRGERAYEGYGYARVGRTRRGDPRPGSMRYNLAQSLGGIY
jgi:hypothetical protein